MNTLDQIGVWIGGTVIVASVVSVSAAKIASWATLNHHTRLAIISAAAAREAGRIADLLGDMEPSAVTPQAKANLIQEGGKFLIREFSTIAPKLGLTAGSAAAMVWGELGKLNSAPSLDKPISAPVAAFIADAIKTGTTSFATRTVVTNEALIGKIVAASNSGNGGPSQPSQAAQ